MKIYNTLSGQKEDFQPLGDEVKMYVCGVTVYDNCHIGHAMSYIIFDMIKRYLIYRGYKVKHVQNFTDIDDKIINRANQLKVSPRELAEKYIQEYFIDMDALNIQRATLYPRATEEIKEIIEIIEGLIDRDFAYVVNGDVFFRVKKYSNYGQLSRQKIDEMSPESTAESEKKESPLDFALWKSAKPGEPYWDSPWGKGRPGWHIECTAMALKYLGKQIDIHGGGQDLVFPHHENEITQSESYTGIRPFAKYWIHNGLLQLKGNKMSKSLGNLVTIKEMLELYSPDAIRLFVLSSHYRSPLVFNDEALSSAEAGTERLRQSLQPAEKNSGLASNIDLESMEKRFVASMDDDFNSAQAIAVLFDIAREINRSKELGQDVTDAQAKLRELAGVLGFTLGEPNYKPLDSEALVELLVSIRDEMRKQKHWQVADKIRDDLTKLGVVLQDTPAGTKWRRKRQV